jgi:hypothetical protein
MHNESATKTVRLLEMILREGTIVHSIATKVVTLSQMPGTAEYLAALDNALAERLFALQLERRGRQLAAIEGQTAGANPWSIRADSCVSHQTAAV